MHSISIEFKNKKERDNMWDFISTLPWSAILATERSSPVAVKKGEDVISSRLEGRKKIIFQSHLLPQWAWGLSAWMATKSSFKLEDDWSVLIENEEEVYVLPFHTQQNQTLEVDSDGVITSWRDNPQKMLNAKEQKEMMREINCRWKRGENFKD